MVERDQQGEEEKKKQKKKKQEEEETADWYLPARRLWALLVTGDGSACCALWKMEGEGKGDQ